MAYERYWADEDEAQRLSGLSRDEWCVATRRYRLSKQTIEVYHRGEAIAVGERYRLDTDAEAVRQNAACAGMVFPRLLAGGTGA